MRTETPVESGFVVALAAAALAAVLGCGAREEAAPPDATIAAQASPEPAELSSRPCCRPVSRPSVEPFTGDLDGMVERRVIRVLTVQLPILYFVDQAREAGTTDQAIKAFEGQLNQKLGKKVVTVHVSSRSRWRVRAHPAPDRRPGRHCRRRVLAITPERQQQVAVLDPFAAGVREVLVTGPAAPPGGEPLTCSGKEVYVRPSRATPSTCGSSTRTSRPPARRR